MAKVMISIPDQLLKEIDAAAKATHRKRSEFFKESVLRYLHWIHPAKREFADLEQAASTGLDFWNNPIDDEIWNAPAAR